MRREDDESLNEQLTLIRSNYAKHASPEARKVLVADFRGIGESLASREVAEKKKRVARLWCLRAQELTPNVSDDLRARVLLQLLLTDPVSTTSEFFRATSGFLSRSYSARYMASIRQRALPLWGDWINAVNEWLSAHPEESDDSAVVLQALSFALRVRTQSDAWDVKTLLQLLTERLRQRYSEEDASEEVEEVTTSTHDLLACIILAGGDIPEFVIARPPRLRNPNALERFKALFKFKPLTSAVFQRARPEIGELIAQAPYHTVKTAVEGLKPASNRLMEVIHSASSPGGIEPLLLLAVATKLSGVTADQDTVIAEFFGPDNLLRRPMNDALGYPFAIRPLAQEWLRRMYVRSKSDLLSDAVKRLYPGVDRGDDDVASVIAKPDKTAQATPKPSPTTPMYQGETVDVWKARFANETNPIAKIEAGKALITMIEDPSANGMKDFLEIGGTLIKDGWGSDVGEAVGSHLYSKKGKTLSAALVSGKPSRRSGGVEDVFVSSSIAVGGAAATRGCTTPHHSLRRWSAGPSRLCRHYAHSADYFTRLPRVLGGRSECDGRRRGDIAPRRQRAFAPAIDADSRILRRLCLTQGAKNTGCGLSGHGGIAGKTGGCREPKAACACLVLASAAAYTRSSGRLAS